MKRAILFFCAVLLSSLVMAQVPNAFNYQAVARDASGDPIVEQNIGVRVTIRSITPEAEPVYMEIFLLETNAFGLFNLEIGRGSVVYGDFDEIPWGEYPHYLQLEVDPEGGSSYLDLGTSELLSVPYAIQAGMATEAIVPPDGAIIGDLLFYDGDNWVAKRARIADTGSGQTHYNMPPYQVLNFCIALQGVFPSRNILEPFIGTIATFGFNFAPRGWAKCDGQLLSISQYQALFALVGTYYGGDGRTVFGLPDLRGRMPMHQGQGSGLSNRIIGQKSGMERVSLNVGEIPVHSHTIIYE